MPTVSIKSRGQITIPKKIRGLLDTAVVPFSVQDGNGIVRVAEGALHRYAGNNKSGADFKKLKDKAWEAATRNKKCKPS